MEIYLVRHTTPDIEKGICYGQSNIDVTESFQKEIKSIKEKLPLSKEFKLYSSPLLRCYKLASEIGNNIIIDSKLKELNFGSWENKRWENIPKEEIDPWMEDFVNKKPTEGESYLELQNRMIDFFKIMKQKYDKNQVIIIICHAGPIRALLSYIQKTDLKDSFNVKVDYGQVFKI